MRNIKIKLKTILFYSLYFLSFFCFFSYSLHSQSLKFLSNLHGNEENILDCLDKGSLPISYENKATIKPLASGLVAESSPHVSDCHQHHCKHNFNLKTYSLWVQLPKTQTQIVDLMLNLNLNNDPKKWDRPPTLNS